MGLHYGYWGALVFMGLGMLLGLCVVALGLVFLVREDGAVSRAEAGTLVPRGSEAPAQQLSIEARHLGNLELEINARLLLPEGSAQQEPAELVAYTDMLDMPQAHLQGPLAMVSVPDRPGVYTTRARVPMVGTYEVRVEARRPVQASARGTVFVGTVSPAGAPRP